MTILLRAILSLLFFISSVVLMEASLEQKSPLLATNEKSFIANHTSYLELFNSDSINPQIGNTIGNVVFTVDSSITQLEKERRGFKDIKGYRVQLLIGNAETVKAERNKYLSLGLPYSAYMRSIVPEVALQIGDFMNRMELEKHLEVIKKYYPKAFPVVEVIEPPKFGKR